MPALMRNPFRGFRYRLARAADTAVTLYVENFLIYPRGWRSRTFRKSKQIDFNSVLRVHQAVQRGSQYYFYQIPLRLLLHQTDFDKADSRSPLAS